MNIKLLQTMAELSGGECNDIDVDKFFYIHPKSKSIYSDLAQLNKLGFITALYASDDISAIGINKSGIDYLNKIK